MAALTARRSRERLQEVQEVKMGAIRTGANGLGKFLMGLGFVGGGANWLSTFIFFLMEEENALAALTFFAPPAAFITAFVADTALGILGVASIAAILLGGALAGDSL